MFADTTKHLGSFADSKTTSVRTSGGEKIIRFTPPEWTELAAAFDNWEQYYHDAEEEPLVKLALLHAQFEFLHPFLDGNGRIGHLIIPIFLYEQGLLSQPTFYLSEYIEEHRDEYVDRLHDLGTKKLGWRNWTIFFLDAVTAQSERNIDKAEQILALHEELKDQFIEVTGSKYAVPLLDAVFELQYFQVSQLRWNGQKPSKPTIMTMLNSLESKKIISVYRDPVGRRAAIWWLPALVQLTNR